MDIGTLEIPKTVKVHLEFPGVGKLYGDDAKTHPVVIEMCGPASDQFVEWRRKLTRQVQAEMAKKGLKGIASGDPDEQALDRLCALTASVSNLVYNGEKITASTIRKVYADPKMGWIRDQVREKIASWEDFLS